MNGDQAFGESDIFTTFESLERLILYLSALLSRQEELRVIGNV